MSYLMLILQCIWHGLKHICVGIILWFSWTSYEIEDTIFDVDIAVYLAWSISVMKPREESKPTQTA